MVLRAAATSRTCEKKG
jgi:hypothetical protein